MTHYPPNGPERLLIPNSHQLRLLLFFGFMCQGRLSLACVLLCFVQNSVGRESGVVQVIGRGGGGGGGGGGGERNSNKT